MEPVLPFFVYGTLRHGQGNYARLLDGRTVDEQPAWLDGHVMYGAGVPFVTAATHGERSATIVGELMVIDPTRYLAVLASLDYLEGYRPDRPQNSMYVRAAREVRAAGQAAPVTAWVYLAGAGGWWRESDRIVDGDWVAARARAGSARLRRAVA